MAIVENPEIIIDSCLDMNSEEEDEENRDEHEKPLINDNSTCDESTIPLSIGKIKIFKPRRRTRGLMRKYLTMCLSILVLIFFLIYIFKMKNSFSQTSNKYKSSQTTCDELITIPVWNKTFPMLTIESALRLVDVNNDTILDVIVPFGTGVDAAYYQNVLCQIYFNQTEGEASGCGGGVMAIDGRSGLELWRRYTPHELYASNCNNDLNDDGIKDCILAGRMASLYAIDGSTGDIIWSLTTTSGDPVVETSNFYTPLYIPRDIDGDGVPELVVMHGGDPLRKPNERTRIAGRLIILSTKKGSILSWSAVPDEAESYYSPQLLVHPDGTLLIMFGTGGETHAGSLYVISFDDLLQGKIKNSRLIYSDCCKGVMVPPVLIDINDDDILDIIMSLFNSTVIAFDGLTFEVLWKTEFPGSETYCTPAVGYFNNDTTPDFAVIYQFGPGFPIYYHTQLSILDGKNGKHLLKTPIDMLIGTQSSPLTISTLTANDIFLYWYSTCENGNISSTDSHKAQKFKIAPGTTVHDNSRADFCKLRFNSTLFTQLRAISPTSNSILYDSRAENISYVNYTAIGYQWIQENLGPSDDDSIQNFQNTDSDQQIYQPSYQEYPPKYEEPRNPYPDNSFDQTFPISYDRRYEPRARYKRHVGVHDGKGVQRVISTGTLAPPLNGNLDTIDLIFATFWFPASKKVHLMSPEMEKCISHYMDPKVETRLRLEDRSSHFKQLKYDHDSYEEEVKEICSSKTNEQQPQNKLGRNNLIKEMGSMTLYRVNLKCSSNRVDSDVVAIKEYSYQWWPSYLGKDADCVVNVNDVSLGFK